ncbi:unnamed protein product [Parascedosporium putredinis]|uniref:MARVEL domain-containing protein n=1 Tax=Parascedosporium putredinis TaxID=1442378 RepID=A0A9P1MCG3_9PEZI|nr:unnamed protein product [Parascedosporium putredinis]CAI8001523.1 unnamed protein product [Parascedosporium putredinis]
MNIRSLSSSYLVFSALHIVLFTMAIVSAALYGIDLANRSPQNNPKGSRWIFAEVVAGLSAITSVLYLIPDILRSMCVWIWDLVLFILWISLFGVFGKMFIHEPVADHNSSLHRMKAAVWVDLANAILWLVATLATATYWWGHKERRSRFTGRASLY